MLANADKDPTSISTSAKVTLAIVDGKPTITKIALDTVGVVPGMSGEEFTQFAEEAHAACLVTRALSGVSEITLASAELKS